MIPRAQIAYDLLHWMQRELELRHELLKVEREIASLKEALDKAAEDDTAQIEARAWERLGEEK